MLDTPLKLWSKCQYVQNRRNHSSHGKPLLRSSGLGNERGNHPSESWKSFSTDELKFPQSPYLNYRSQSKEENVCDDYSISFPVEEKQDAKCDYDWIHQHWRVNDEPISKCWMSRKKFVNIICDLKCLIPQAFSLSYLVSFLCSC